MNFAEKISGRSNSLTGGLSLWLMAILAGFAYGYVFQSLYVANNPQTTFDNFYNNQPLLQSFIITFSIVLILDIIVSFSFYYFFVNINKKISFFSFLARMIYTFIAIYALWQFVFIQQLFSQEIKDVLLVQENIETFLKYWSWGLLIFGFHLMSLGFLIIQSGFVPKVIGLLAAFAGICYTVTNILNLFYPEYQQIKPTVEMILSLPMALGELVFATWLIVKGGKTK